MDDLVVKVGADITGFLSKIDAAKAKVNQLTEEQQGLKNVIKDLNTSLRINEKELTVANVKLQKLNTSTVQGKQAAKELRAEIAQLAANSKTLSTSLTSAQTNLATTTTQLKKSAIELKAAERATGGFAGGIKNAFSGLRMLANFLPGIGLAGLIGLAVEPMIALADKTKAAREALKEYADEMAKAAGSAQTEVASIKNLIGIAQNESLTRKARTGAIRELQKEYPEYLANINIENINSVAASLAVDSLTASIGRKAKMQALANIRTKEEEKLFKLQNQDLSENVGMWDAINALITSGGNKAKIGAKLVVKAEENKASAIFNTQLAIAKLNSQMDQLATDQAVAGDFSKFLPDKEKAAKSVKAVESIADVIAKVRHQIDDVLVPFEQLFNTSKATEKISTLTSAITKLFEQFKPGAKREEAIIEFKLEMDEVKEREELRKELFKIKPKEVAVPIALTLAPATAVIPVFQQLEKQVLPEVAKLNQSIADNLKSGMNEGLAGIGQAIGQAIGEGGDIGKAMFRTLFETISMGLKELGKAMIALGTAKIVLEKFNFAPGVGTVIAGIATVALGQLLQSALPKFQTGGLVTGPGTSKSDSILARLSNREFIMSAKAVAKFGTGFFDMLNRGFLPRGMNTGGSVGSNSIGGGQLIYVQVEGKLAGRDIHLSNKRTGITLGHNG